MSSNLETINIDSQNCPNTTLFCYFCKEKGSPVKYYPSSKKTWCDVCQAIWVASQVKIAPVFEECQHCNDTCNPVRYYNSSCKRWCDMCQDLWQDDEYQAYLDDIEQERISDRKMERRFGERRR